MWYQSQWHIRQGKKMRERWSSWTSWMKWQTDIHQGGTVSCLLLAWLSGVCEPFRGMWKHHGQKRMTHGMHCQYPWNRVGGMETECRVVCRTLWSLGGAVSMVAWNLRKDFCSRGILHDMVRTKLMCEWEIIGNVKHELQSHIRSLKRGTIVCKSSKLLLLLPIGFKVEYHLSLLWRTLVEVGSLLEPP